MVSVSGLNDSRPEKAIAVTISGDDKKFIVWLMSRSRETELPLYENPEAERTHLFASFLALKFLVYDFRRGGFEQPVNVCIPVE